MVWRVRSCPAVVGRALSLILLAMVSKAAERLRLMRCSSARCSQVQPWNPVVTSVRQEVCVKRVVWSLSPDSVAGSGVVILWSASRVRGLVLRALVLHASGSLDSVDPLVLLDKSLLQQLSPGFKIFFYGVHVVRPFSSSRAVAGRA